jgi:hypothetical protein
MRDRLAALIRLKLILARNRFFQQGAVSSLFELLLLVGIITGALLLAVVAFAGTMLAVDGPKGALFAFGIYTVAVLVFWMIDFMSEIQKGDLVDMGELLYLPVTLREVYLFHFVASLACPAFILTAPAGCALALGCAVSVHPLLLLAVAPVLLLEMALAAWVYHVRSWIARLMVNKRRGRSIVAFLTLAMVLLFQTPHLLTRVVAHDARNNLHAPAAPELDGVPPPEANALVEQFDRDMEAYRKQRIETRQSRRALYQKILPAVPPAWLAVAAGGLAEGRLFPEAVPATGGLALLGLAGLGMGYRSARRHYYGTVGGKSRARRPERAAATVKPPLTLKGLPFVSEQTAAMAWAFLLTWWRQPQMRNGMIITLFIGAGVFILPMAMKSGDQFVSGAMLPVLVIGWPLLSGGVYLFNAFGADPEGFRALVLMPAPRRSLLLGVNLGLYPLVGGVSAVFTGLMAVLAQPGWQTALACLLLSVQVYVLVSAGGNFVSVLLPYRFQWPGGGGRRKRGAGGKPVLPGFAALGCIALAMAPALGILGLDLVLRETQQLTRIPIGLLGAALLLMGSVTVYRFLLPHAAHLLEAREQRILEILQKDQE